MRDREDNKIFYFRFEYVNVLNKNCSKVLYMFYFIVNGCGVCIFCNGYIWYCLMLNMVILWFRIIF